MREPGVKARKYCLGGLFGACVATLLATSAAAQDLSRLQGILATLPQGGWAQVNTGTFSSAWPTGLTAVPESQGYNDPASVVRAWSSFAWNSTNGSILLWGGGHANYSGNEMYVWSAATGGWSRGSLPSRIDLNTSQNFIVDNAAPQSAHTYDNNVYLPVNQQFLTFGGAGFPGGLPLLTNINGVTQTSGPWLWDPTKADANKVGGTTGSGYDPSSLGGNMWTNRAGQATGSNIPTFFVQSVSAARVEAGQDTVYVTSNPGASGWPDLYRYRVGNVASGGLDQWVKVGVSNNAWSFQGAATLDNQHNLFIRNATSSAGADLAVWNLSSFNGTTAIGEIPVQLKYGDGTDFVMSPNTSYGLDFDQQSGLLLMWDSVELGTVYYVTPSIATNGTPNSVWTVTRVVATTPSQPSDVTTRGVLGKWKYVDELDAFLAISEFNTNTGDAGVWLYKPYQVAPVPERGTFVMMLAGLLVMAMRFSPKPRTRVAALGEAPGRLRVLAMHVGRTRLDLLK